MIQLKTLNKRTPKFKSEVQLLKNLEITLRYSSQIAILARNYNYNKFRYKIKNLYY